MATLDTQDWIRSAHRYMKLRRRYIMLFLGMVAFMVIVGAFSIVTQAFSNDSKPTWREAIFCLIVFAGWTVVLLAWWQLFRCRCPRCEGQFMVRWPGMHCYTCDLDLRPAAMAKEPSLVDEVNP